MGHIRVRDLAKKMGLEEQDLLFKLRSIGVRVDGADSEVDPSTLAAVLQGKRVASPREVIIRDAKAKQVTRAPKPEPAPVKKPMKKRRRSMIQKVEPHIRAIPVTEKAKATPPIETSEPTPPVAPPEEPKVIVEQKTTAKPEVQAEEKQATQPKTPKKETAPPRKSPKKAEAPRPVKARKAKPSTGARLISKPSVAPVKSTGARLLSKPVPKKPVKPSKRAMRRQARKDDLPPAKAKSIFSKTKPDGPITIVEGMTVRDFAEKMGVKAKDLIGLLVQKGVLATINHVMDLELAEELASDLDIETMMVSYEEEIQLQQEASTDGDNADKESRPPVVTIMGHVDHGKTTLLDAIRGTKVVDSEHGGITQHIGAYQVELDGKKISFVDTPGHEAFTMMRARGAKVTDIVVLVVAADDGVMPQTIEAIDHSRAAKVPIIVAVNKIDKNNANPDRVKTELAERDLVPEDWGGDTVMVPLSALKGEGIEDLLEMINLTAEMLELKAVKNTPAQGVVLESRREIGRGTVATVLVQSGTLKKGDIYVAGASWGRVRTMSDENGKRIQQAPPSTPVEITGFTDVPRASDPFQVLPNENEARRIAGYRKEEQRQRELAPTTGRISLDQLFDQLKAGELKELPVVVKGDVQGSLEVLNDSLPKLSTEKVKIKVIHSSIGAITTNDVILASASNAIVVGFNVRPEKKAVELAAKEQVDLRLYTVIYELYDEMKAAMVGLLDPTFKEVIKGVAEVREIFRIPKIGTIAGCHVVEGLVPRSADVRVLRDNVVVHEGSMGSLRRFKDDVSEVRTGFDCGIGLERFQDLKPKDLIEAYIREEVAATLE